jgi:hypothetical protein
MTDEHPHSPPATLPQPPDSGYTPMRPPTRRRRRIPWVLLVVVAVALTGAGGVWATSMLVTLAGDLTLPFSDPVTPREEPTSPEGGYEYSTAAFTVVFPGEPTTATDKVPGTEYTAATATWQDLGAFYGTRYAYIPDHTITVEGALESSLAASGATLIESAERDMDGATAVEATVEIDGVEAWTMWVLTDDNRLLVLTQVGAERDDAFFDSLVLHKLR